MSASAVGRYDLPEVGTGIGQDLLLDQPVLIVRLPSGRPEALSRSLRLLPPSPWLPVVDAFALPDHAVLVLPAPVTTLAAGAPTADLPALSMALQPTIAALADLGLTVQTLDPQDIGVTDRGQPLLVPAVGAPAGTEQVGRLLGFLHRGSSHASAALTTGAPAALVDPEDLDPREAHALLDNTDAPTTAQLPLPAGPAAVPAQQGVGEGTQAPKSILRPMPRAGLTPAETGARARRGPQGRARTAALSLAAAGLVLATGYVATSSQQQDGPVGGASGAPVAAESDLDRAVQTLRPDPAAAGPGGLDLLRRLEQVRAATGNEQMFAAAGALQAIEVGIDGGRLDAQAAQPAAASVRPLAKPTDLDGLIAVVVQDPGAFGPHAEALLAQLLILRDRLQGEQARARAHDLWQHVGQDRQRRLVTATFGELATPVLRDLAVPDDLGGLVAAAGDRPARFGPRMQELLRRLDALQRLKGEPRRAEAGELLTMVRNGVGKGEFTGAFRDISIPVLQPLTVREGA